MSKVKRTSSKKIGAWGKRSMFGNFFTRREIAAGGVGWVYVVSIGKRRGMSWDVAEYSIRSDAHKVTRKLNLAVNPGAK